MEYTLSNFEGPLDLLLHLIKEANIDIFDINIEEITKQYLEYINKMQQLDLNVASEYLVMAAELIEMKSRTLLPNNETEEDTEIDPRENLINRLLEYQRYKNMTSLLKECEDKRKEYFTKEPDDLSEYKTETEENYDNITIDILTEALRKFLGQKELDKPLTTKVTNKEYSVIIRSNEIKNILKAKKKVLFTDLFDIYSKDYIIVTFLSILELVKKSEILIKQDKNFGDIYLGIKGCEL